MLRSLTAVVLLAALAGATSILAGLPAPLDPSEIDRALRLARSNENERRKFHSDYFITAAEPTVTSLDVVTEFRRLVLITEENIATGAWTYIVSQRTALAALKPWTGKVSVRVRIRFPPLKVYPGTPAVDIEIGDSPNAIRPVKTDSRPEYGMAGRGAIQPMVGVFAEGIFEAAAVPKERLPVIVRTPDKITVRGAVDFGTLR